MGSHHLLPSKPRRSHWRLRGKQVRLSPLEPVPPPSRWHFLPSKQHLTWAEPPLVRVLRGLSQDWKRTNPWIQQLLSRKCTCRETQRLHQELLGDWTPRNKCP